MKFFFPKLFFNTLFQELGHQFSRKMAYVLTKFVLYTDFENFLFSKKNSLLFLAFLLLYGNVTILKVPAFAFSGGSEFRAITLQPQKNLLSVKK
jgi:hypothetical protein